MTSNLTTTSDRIALVVEDELLIRMNTVDMFEDLGFVVVEAANADDAKAILAARQDVNLVFTDIDMPGSMNGLQLASHVSRVFPDIQVIVTSGHVDVRDKDLPKDVKYIGKPYHLRTIANALDEAFR